MSGLPNLVLKCYTLIHPGRERRGIIWQLSKCQLRNPYVCVCVFGVSLFGYDLWILYVVVQRAMLLHKLQLSTQHD